MTYIPAYYSRTENTAEETREDKSDNNEDWDYPQLFDTPSTSKHAPHPTHGAVLASYPP